MASIFGRQVVLVLTNKSGGGVVAGDVVIVDTSNDAAFTTTTSAGYTGGVGVAQETIANNATGRVLFAGYAALVNVNASVTRGQYGTTHTVAKQATGTASRGAGTFAQWLTGGTTPTARIFSPDLAAAAGNVAVDAIWDAKGDLAAGTGADTASKLTVGANDTILMADSAQSTGLKWVASQTPSTQAFGDAAAEGTADTYARGDHKHAMPASPSGGILAVKKYAPATTVYSTSSATMADVDATNMAVTFTAPASGNVVVMLSAWQDFSANGSANLIWDLRESTTDLNVGGIVNRNTLQEGSYTTMILYLSGISAGSHTYKWSFGLASASGTGRIVVGPGATGTGHFGPGMMVVAAAP